MVGVLAGHVGAGAIRGDRYPDGSGADRDGRGDGVGGRVDHSERARTGQGQVAARAVRREGQEGRAAGSGDGGGDGVGGGVDHADAVRRPVRDVGTGPVGRQRHTERGVADGDGGVSRGQHGEQLPGPNGRRQRIESGGDAHGTALSEDVSGELRSLPFPGHVRSPGGREVG